MNRAEHLQWAKTRAIQEAQASNAANAINSLSSDFAKHPELKRHNAIELAHRLMLSGRISTAQEAIDFINGVS